MAHVAAAYRKRRTDRFQQTPLSSLQRASGRMRARMRGNAGPTGTHKTSQPSHHHQKMSAMSTGTSSAKTKIDHPASFHAGPWLRSTYTGKLSSSSGVKRSHSNPGQPTTAPHTTSCVALSCTMSRTDTWWLEQFQSVAVWSFRACSGRSS